MGESEQDSIERQLREARERVTQEFSAQAEQLDKLGQTLQELRDRSSGLKAALEKEIDSLAALSATSSAAQHPEMPIEKLLSSVRNLITATLPQQVLEILTEEATQLGVRCAAFDVRGKAAWGAAAHGFGPQLNEKAFRALAIPLNQDTPFRVAFETGAHVDANAGMLKKNRNILDKLKPRPEDAILLLPIRSAGSVSAIFYADTGGKTEPLPVDALKILGEFAGAQLDRLMALSGGMPAEARPEPVAEAPVEAEIETVQESSEPMEEPVNPEPAIETPIQEVASAEVIEGSSPPAVEIRAAENRAGIEVAPVSEPVPPPMGESPKPADSAAREIPQLSEEELKLHKDAKRFAKLLISEIELYNKSKVAEGRKNKDLYKRLKTDIERSRQTYEKRFSKTIGSKADYFHEEMIRILANNDVSLMGPEYDGASA